MGDVFYQLAGLTVMFFGVVKVRSHSVAQVDRLADVDDGVLGVAIDIAARLGGQGI